MCGFISATHFSRCYRKVMGRAPKHERMDAYTGVVTDTALADTLTSFSSPSLQALRRARTEPTYGTFLGPGEDTTSG